MKAFKDILATFDQKDLSAFEQMLHQEKANYQAR